MNINNNKSNVIETTKNEKKNPFFLFTHVTIENRKCHGANFIQ